MLPIENSFLTIDFVELILIYSLVSLDLQMYQQNCHVIFFGRSLIRQLKFVFPFETIYIRPLYSRITINQSSVFLLNHIQRYREDIRIQ